MSAEQFEAGKKLMLEKIRALAERGGVTITGVEGWRGPDADCHELRIEATTGKTTVVLAREWIEDLPSGVYDPALDAILRMKVRALK